MPYIITEACIDVMDGACRQLCPVNCIYLPEETRLPTERRLNKLYVNPRECIECDACRDGCPVGAVYLEEQVPQQWQEFVAAEYAAFDQVK